MPVHNWFYQSEEVKTDPFFLLHHGPVLPIEVFIPDHMTQYYTEKGLPFPPPEVGLALIDTGASNSAVDQEILVSLNIPPFDKSIVYTPSGEDEQYLFPVRMMFPTMNLSISVDAVLGSRLKQQEYIALIGRDILTRFSFHYNGPGEFITLAF